MQQSKSIVLSYWRPNHLYQQEKHTYVPRRSVAVSEMPRSTNQHTALQADACFKRTRQAPLEEMRKHTRALVYRNKRRRKRNSLSGKTHSFHSNNIRLETRSSFSVGIWCEKLERQDYGDRQPGPANATVHGSIGDLPTVGRPVIAKQWNEFLVGTLSG